MPLWPARFNLVVDESTEGDRKRSYKIQENDNYPFLGEGRLEYF